MQKPKKEIEKPIQPKTQRPRKPEPTTSVCRITKTIQKYLRKKKEQHVRNQLNVIEESVDY